MVRTLYKDTVIYRNESLFSNHFLETRLSEVDEWSQAPVDISLREKMRAVFESAAAGLPAANEAQTENDLIRPLLTLLAVDFDVQTSVTAWAGHRVPDYALFPSPLALKKSAPLRGKKSFWDTTCGVGDAKSWKTQLDQVGSGGAGRTPAQQLTEYMRDLDLPWGLLTNGEKWRIYSRRPSTRSSDYFEIDLKDALYGSDEDFHLFVLVFGRAGFVPHALDGKTFNDRLLEGSLRFAKKIEDRLRDRAFKTVELVTRGFARHEGWTAPSEEQLASLYENSLVLLYRLLFVLSAEARGLLPMDNPTYRDHYSLTHLRNEIRIRATAGSWAAGSCDIYVRLGNLFRLIDAGDGSLNVPPYNGGLFDSSKHKFLRDSCCRDSELGEAIFHLAFDIDATGTAEAIDYRDIAPRHLGTIYEGLLEFRLTVATQPLGTSMRDGVEHYVPIKDPDKAIVQPGELVLENDKGARRASGSYYTPDYIVDYIVSHALEGPLKRLSQRVSEELRDLDKARLEATGPKLKELENKLHEAQGLTRDRLIEVRVLDPAMGSGHFLVAAMHFIADFVFTDPSYTSGVDDPNGLFLRRRIAERCLFGVDLNELAVELARLTIWLETVAPDRPLSFLDHHLKVGNSLVGASLHQVGELKPSKKAGGTATLAESDFHADLPAVIGDLVEISKTDARNHAEAEAKEARAAAANALLVPYRQTADFWTAVAGFQQPGDQDLLDDFLHGIRSATRRLKAVKDPRGEAATFFARQRHFFHWEVEFPEAFFDETGSRLTAPGFDAVVTNPPYEVLETRQSEFKDAKGQWTAGGQARYEARKTELALQRDYFRKTSLLHKSGAGGKLDYFRLFIEQCLNLTRSGGGLGMIVPRSLLADKSATGVRRLLWSQTELNPVDAFPKDPPSCWVFPEAELAVAVFVAKKVASPGKLRVRVHTCRDLSDALFADVEKDDSELLDSETLPIPIMRPGEIEILREMYGNPNVCHFGDIAQSRIGEINSEYGKPYMKDTPTGTFLVRGRHVSRFHIDTGLRLGADKRWIEEKAYLKTLDKPGARPSLSDRVVRQAITDIEDPRRIIAGLCPSGLYVLDSCDYLRPKEPYSVAYALAVLLSDVSEWRFRMTSSNNNVNAYEIDKLPFPQIADWADPDRASDAAALSSALESVLQNEHLPGAVKAIEKAFAKPISRAAFHDVLDALVHRTEKLRAEAIDYLENFATYLESLPKGGRLPRQFVARHWVELDEAAFFAFLSAEGVELSVALIKKAKSERAKALAALEPLVRMSDLLDDCANVVVHRLLGLDASTQALISGALPPKPAFLPPAAST